MCVISFVLLPSPLPICPLISLVLASWSNFNITCDFMTLAPLLSSSYLPLESCATPSLSCTYRVTSCNEAGTSELFTSVNSQILLTMAWGRLLVKFPFADEETESQGG